MVSSLTSVEEKKVKLSRTVFVLMVVASITFTGLGWALPDSKRLFHHLVTTLTVVSALVYFGLATGSGFDQVKHHVPDTFKIIERDVSRAHFIQWLIAVPLVITNLGILAGVNGASLFTTIAASIIWVLSGLFSALGVTRTQTWGW
jgi:bacteriorhodopsin